LDNRLTVAERVKDVTQVDLYKLHLDNFVALDALLHDPIRLVVFVWDMPRDKCFAKSPDDMKAGFDADSLDRATDAFLDAWIGMQPGKERREGLRQIIASYRAIRRER